MAYVNMYSGSVSVEVFYMRALVTRTLIFKVLDQIPKKYSMPQRCKANT